MIKYLFLLLIISVSFASAIELTDDSSVIGINIIPAGLPGFDNNTGSVNNTNCWTTVEGIKCDVSDITYDEISAGDVNALGYTGYFNFLAGVVGQLSMDGDPWYLAGTDLEIAEELQVDGDSNLNNTYPQQTLSSSLGSGALRWLKLWVQNISAEEIDAFNLVLSNNLTISNGVDTDATISHGIFGETIFTNGLADLQFDTSGSAIINQLNGNNFFVGTLSNLQTSMFYGTLEVIGNSIFDNVTSSGIISADGTITSSGGDIFALAGNIHAVLGDIIAGDDLFVGDDADIGGDLEVSGNSNLTGNTTTEQLIIHKVGFDDFIAKHDPLGYPGFFGTYGDLFLGVAGDEKTYVNYYNGDYVDFGWAGNEQLVTIYGDEVVTGDINATNFNGNWNGSSSYTPYTGATGNVDLGNYGVSGNYYYGFFNAVTGNPITFMTDATDFTDLATGTHYVSQTAPGIISLYDAVDGVTTIDWVLDLKNNAPNLTLYTETGTGTFKISDNVEVDANVTADYFKGDGSELTGIAGGIWTNVSNTATYEGKANVTEEICIAGNKYNDTGIYFGGC